MRIEIPKLNDVWLDNGLATFTTMLIEMEEEDDVLNSLEINNDNIKYSFANIEKFCKELSLTVISKIDNMVIIGEDKKTSEKKEFKKDHILIQENSKIGGKVAFKESIFDKEKTLDVLKDAYNNLEEGKNNCFFCSRPFKKSIKKIQQASYPFVTKIKSLSGIRSGKDINLQEYISEYCPQCYLLGILEWLDDSIVYRNLPGEKSIIILPNKENLKDLIKLKKEINSNVLENSNRWSNILIDFDKKETDNTPDKFSTFISFYENFLRKVKPELDNENWYIIEIPAGAVKNPKYFNIMLEENISRILKILTRQDNSFFYRIFVKEFYAFNTDLKKGIRNFDFERELHEKLCESLVNNDFNQFADAFMPRKGIKPGISKDAYKVLEKLIYYWRIEPMKMENKEEFLKKIRTASHTLSRLIGDRPGLFFKLEKAKNPNQFFEALQEITRRVIIEKDKVEGYEKNAFEEISKIILVNENDKEIFETTKNILLIYTSLRTKNENNNKEEN